MKFQEVKEFFFTIVRFSGSDDCCKNGPLFFLSKTES